MLNCTELCCNQVQVHSAGPSSNHQWERMGYYVYLTKGSNGKAIYQDKRGYSQNLIKQYLFMDSNGNWVVSRTGHKSILNIFSFYTNKLCIRYDTFHHTSNLHIHRLAAAILQTLLALFTRHAMQIALRLAEEVGSTFRTITTGKLTFSLMYLVVR